MVRKITQGTFNAQQAGLWICPNKLALVTLSKPSVTVAQDKIEDWTGKTVNFNKQLPHIDILIQMCSITRHIA